MLDPQHFDSFRSKLPRSLRNSVWASKFSSLVLILLRSKKRSGSIVAF